MKLSFIYALEISGTCNLACSYCPYHKGQRQRGLMDWDTLKHVAKLLNERRFYASIPLHLHLFGEPLMHPEFADMALWLQKTVIGMRLSVSTNCTLMTPEWANRLARIDWQWVTLSPHSPKDVAKATISLQARGVKTRQQEGPDHNWAGQVRFKTVWSLPCEFSGYGKFVVRWNGDVALCCITDNDLGVVGTIWDEDLSEKEHHRFELCSACHLQYEVKDHARARGLVGNVVGVPALRA